MRNSKNIQLTVMCLLAGFLLITEGCNKKGFCPEPEDVDFEQISPLTVKLNADIYIDASFSMVGFVNPGNSYYIRTLQMLERAFISGWPKRSGNLKFYKFGSKMSEINRDQALSAAFAEFYMDPEFRAQTRIEKVIKNADNSNLNIIITDLFQIDADVNILIEKLNQKFLTKDNSVGVLGIKSHFNGKVFDVGLEDFNFNYFTNPGRKVHEYRPFYLLIIGKYKDITHYYEMLKINGLSNFPEKNFIIFSPRLVERLATFENSEVKPTKIREVLKILRTSSICRDVKQFMINDNSSKSYFDTTIELSFLKHIPVNFSPGAIKAEITAKKCQEIPGNGKDNDKKEKETSIRKLINCEEALRAFDINEIKISETRINFKVEIESKHFPGNGIYCFRVVFYPSSESYSLPKWILEWDMDQNLIYHWQQYPGEFQGNTTLNLKNFLNNIWQIVYQKHKPKIAKLYCYIQRG